MMLQKENIFLKRKLHQMEERAPKSGLDVFAQTVTN